MASWRIIYSCPDCGADLEDDERGLWCPDCETLWSYGLFADDPPEYQHPEDDND